MAMIDQLAQRVNNTVKQSQNNRSVLTKVADFFTDDDLDKTKYLGEVSKAREDIWNSQIMPKLKAAKANDATVSQAYRTWSKQVDDWSTSNGFKLRQGQSINQQRQQNMVKKLADTEKSGSASDKVAAKAKVAKVSVGAGTTKIQTGAIDTVRGVLQAAADMGKNNRKGELQSMADFVKARSDDAKARNIALKEIEDNPSTIQKFGLMAANEVAPMALGGSIGKLAAKSSLALGSTAVTAGRAGMVAGQTLNAARTYGGAKDTAVQEIQNINANQLATHKDEEVRNVFNQYLDEYRKAGKSEAEAIEEARLDTINDLAEGNANQVTAISSALELIAPGVGGMGARLVTRSAGDNIAGGIIRNTVGKVIKPIARHIDEAPTRNMARAVAGQTSRTAAVKGVVRDTTKAFTRQAAEEGAQEGYEDYAGQQFGVDMGMRDKVNWEQTGESAMYGALLGGLMGGGAEVSTQQTPYLSAKEQLKTIQQTQAATNAQLNTLQQQHSQLSQVANPTPEQKQQIQAIESNIRELETVKSDNEANAQRLNIPEPVLNKHVETPYSSTLNPQQAQTDNADNPAAPDTNATAQTASPTDTTTNPSASPTRNTENNVSSNNGGFDVNQYLDLDANSLEQAWVNHQKEMADDATITDGTDQMSVQDAIEHANNTIAEENTTPQVQGGISGVVARNQQRQTQGELESEMEDWHAKKQQLQAERDAKLAQEMNTPDEPAIKLMDVNDGEHFDTTVIGLNGEPFRLANAWDSVIPAKAKQQAITTVFAGRLPQKLASASWGELHPQVQKKLHTWFAQELNNRRSEREQSAMPQLGMRTVNPQPMNELPSGNDPINLGHVAADNTPVDIPVNANSQPITFAQSEPNNQALPESGLQNLGEMENLAPSMQTELSQVDEAPTTDGAGINDKAAEIDNLIDAAKANGKYNIKNKEIILKSNGIPFSTQATLLTAIKNRKLKVDDYDIVSDGSRFVGLNKHSDLAMAPEEQLPTNDQGSTANLPSVQQDSSELPGEAKANELIDNRYIINHVAKKPGETEDVRSETVEPIERQAETLQGEPVANVAKADAPTTESKDVANEANGLITPDGNEVNATTAKNQKTSSTDSHDISQDNPAFDTENAKHSSKDNPSVNPENHAATDANITVGSATVGTEPRISEGDKPQYSKREQGEIGVNTRNRYAVVSDERARSIVSRIIDSIRSNASIEPLSHQKTGIMDFPIEVVPSFEALPEFIKQDSTFVDNDGKTQRYEVFGVWYEGKLYINSGDIRGDSQTGITTEQMYEQTILHEIVGHYGIQKLFGDSYKTQLAQLWNAIGGVPALRKIAHNNGVDMQAFERDYITPYLSWKQEEKYTADEVHQALIGEMFAHIAQNGKPTVKQRLKALVGYVRNWLRERGLMSLDKYNDSDILMFLNEAKRAAVDPKFHGKFANRKISQLNNQENNDKKNNSNIHDYSRSQSNQSEAQELIKLKRGDITIKPELLNNGKKFIDFYYRNEKLSDFLSDNHALQAYPQLGDIKVESAGFFDALFSYDKANNTIRVPMSYTNKQMEQGVFAILKDEVVNLQKGMKPAKSAQTSNISKEQDQAYLDLATRYEQGDTSVEPQLREMVNKAAQDNGFDSDTSFRMSHAAPINDGFNDSADNLRNMFGEDIYSDNALHYFGMGDEYLKADRESLQAINRAKGKPNTMITVYRAMPKDAKGTAIGNGDWVTTSKEYAKEHGNHALNGDYKIISRVVPAKHLFNNGDSIHEWGVDTGQDLLRSKTVDREKLSDLITYDDKGKIIPLSKRFDAAKKDVRYSKTIKGNTNTTPTQVRDTLVKQHGEKTIKALEDAGVLHIKQLSDFVDDNGNLSIADDAEGFYHDGKAVLIADNIDANQIVPVFLHEVGGHAGLQNMLSPNAYANLMQTYNAMVARGDEIALRAKARAELASENQDQATTEYLPYLLSEISNAQAKTPFIKRLLDRFVGAVRAWVYAKTGVRMNLTHADILGLAELTINERARNIERTAKLIKQVNKQYSQPATNQSIDEVNKTFNDELKQYVAGKLNGSHVFKLGYPNQILKSTGFPNQPIELRASKLSEKANTEWHKFDIAEVKDLPKALEHPLAVFYYYNQARNVITQIEVGGKQLLVGIHFTQNSKGIEINDIRGLFPKDNHEWLNWITESNPKGDSKLMYVDKQKIQALIDQQRTNLAEVEYLDLDLVESIVQKFENVNTPSYSRRFAPVPQTPIPKKPTLEQAKNWLNKQWATKWVGWHVFSRLIRRNTNTPYHVAKQNPDFKKFDNLVQQRIAYVTYEASNAVDLVPEILDKHLIVGQNEKDIEAVSKVIFDGTMNDIVYGDTELRSKGLNDKQIDLYRRVRQAIDESVEKMAIDVLANSAKGTGLISLDEILRIKEAVLANGGNIAMFNNAMQQAVNAKIQAMQQAGIIDAAKATKLTTMFDKVAEQMDKVEDRVYDLQDKGYAPLMRFGSYAVAVEDNQGDLVLYELYESEKAQQDAIFDLKKDPRFAGMKINENVLNPNDYQQFTNKGLNPETVMLFANELGLSSDEANQAYLKVAIAQQSALKRLIHRKKVAGFSEDLPRVLSAFVMSNARHSARMLYNGDIEKSIQGIKDGNLRGEAQKVFENMENPQEEFSSMRSLLFHWSMGFSPAFGLVNMTQLSVQTIPELTMYGGARLAHKEVVYGLARAVASLKPGGKEFVDRLPGYMKANYERMRKEGHLDPQNAWLLQGLERGKAGIASGALGGWSQIAGIPAEITETINRRATMYAALEIANKLGAAKLKAKGFDSAYDFAVDVIRATQGTYNKGNRVGLARANGPLGRFGPLIMVFKQYTINLIEQQYRMLKAGEFKAFATSQAYMWFFAGMMGLIGADDLKDILETIFFKLGVAVNVNRWTQERFINAFGKEWGNELYQIFMYGPLSTVSPVDIHGRTSAGNILPATGILHPANAKDQKAEATEALGVSMSWMSDMFDAGGLMMQGHYRDAMVTGAPRYIRDTIQSVEIATTGEMRDKQGRKVMDMTPKDAAAKALQFNPNSNAHRGREAMLNYQDKKVIEKVQSDFSIYLAEAIATNDQPAQDKVYAEIDQWNQRNEKQYEMDKAKITKSAKKRAEKKDFSSEERQTLPKNLEAYVESLKAS